MRAHLHKTLSNNKLLLTAINTLGIVKKRFIAHDGSQMRILRKSCKLPGKYGTAHMTRWKREFHYTINLGNVIASTEIN